MYSPLIAIVGAGNVGATTAYTLMRSHLSATVGLADIESDLCKGHCSDLEDGSANTMTSHIVSLSLDEVRHADIIIIAAGKPQKPGQSRLDLCAYNCHLVETLTTILKPVNPHAHLIIVTNPVDVLTTLFMQTHLLPAPQIFGTGTYLDTQRFRIYLSHYLNVSATAIQGFVLGEHGDSQFIPWQYVTIGGIPAEEYHITQETRHDIASKTRHKAYTIIKQKCATYFGIAACIDELCHAIIYDRRIIAPLSWSHNNIPVCLSLPVILGAQGVEPTISLSLTAEQETLLQQSIDQISRILFGS